MKNSIKVLSAGLSVALLIPTQAFAVIGISCGQKENYSADDAAYKPEVFGFYSEDEEFSGPTGENWTADVNGQRLKGDKVSISTVETRRHIDSITVTVTKFRTTRGDVGTEYKVTNPYSEPKLTVTTFGGVMAPRLQGPYPCISNVD